MATRSPEERLAVLEQEILRLDREMDRVRDKVHTLESSTRAIEILAQQVPKLTEFMQAMDVQQQVELALDERNIRGTSGRDKLLVAALSACLLVISIVTLLPRVIS